MRFLLVEKTLKNRQLLDILKLENHDVALLSGEKDPLHNTFHKPQDALEWKPDAAIFIDPGMGELARAMSQTGVKTVNGSVYHDYLNNDPEYANVLASRVKVPVMALDNGGFHLHLAGFYSGKHFVGPALSYSIDYGLVRDNKTQPAEACAIHKIPMDSKIVLETFGKLTKLFTAIQFCGIIFLDVQIDPDTGHPHIHRMSVAPPEGFVPAFLAGLEQEVGRFLYGLASGKNFTYNFTNEVSGSVKVSLPPYPHHTLSWIKDDETRAKIQSQLSLEYPTHSLPYQYNDMYWRDALPNEEGLVDIQGPEVGYVSAAASFYELPYVLDGLANTMLDLLPEAQWRSSAGKELATSLAYFEDCGLL